MTEAYVTDTHPLVWFAGNQRRKLGRKAKAAFEAFEAGEAVIWAPAPVVLETWFLVQNGSIKPKTTLRAWWRELTQAGVASEPFGIEDVLGAAGLDWAHADPFDRMIVAVALRLELPLITADGAIADSGLVRVLW